MDFSPSQFFSPNFDFAAVSQQIWEYQYAQNPVIRQYCAYLGTKQPTFIPIEFFKHFEMKAGKWEAEAIFGSSGTTGQTPSRHFVRDLSLYHEISLQGFWHFYPKQAYRILGLLPSYLERNDSSLVQMVKFWIEKFGLPNSGFYLHNFEALKQAIYEAEDAGEPILLIGVAFALLDFADYFQGKMPKNTIVMETGGMKGRKRELMRSEMHELLQKGLGVSHISSEYGMTELISQAYSLKNGRFYCPPWLKIHISDIHLSHIPQPYKVTGRINVIDLGNIHSCSFIATDDLGRMYEDGSFEILGRIDNSEMRGCNLMYL